MKAGRSIWLAAVDRTTSNSTSPGRGLMSGRLVGEVVEWLQTPAAAGLTPAERCVLLVIAERANPETREMWRHRGDDQNLNDRIALAVGVKVKNIGEVFGKLAARGLEVRVMIGQGKDGRPVFAARGRPARFVLPDLPASVALPERESSGSDRTFPVDNSPVGPVDNGSCDERKVRSEPELSAERSGQDRSNSRERSGSDRTLIPLKTYPSKNNPSNSDGPVSQPDVEGGAAGDNEPSAKSDLPRDGPAAENEASDYATAKAALEALPNWMDLLVAARTELGNTASRTQAFTRALQLAHPEGSGS